MKHAKHVHHMDLKIGKDVLVVNLVIIYQIILVMNLIIIAKKI